jgi:hypothetical protein
MAWDKDGRYYTRSRLVNGQVVREYVGGGEAGALIADLDAIERENSSPVERLLVERAVACWLHVQVADARYALDQKDMTLRQGDYHQRRMDAANRRSLAALKALALVRTLAVPALPINSLSPADGDLVLSIRHQDWVIKIDYRNGAGDGPVVWRLGADGDFAVNSTDPNPLRRQDGTPVDAQLSILLAGGKTVAGLTFGGPEFIGGSLADGNYTLTVLADRVHDRWGRELDGDGSGSAGGNQVDSFFRLFGDSDGDGDVDPLDRDRIRSAYKSMIGDVNYLWYFDFDGDGNVAGPDNGQFNRRFGQE